MKKSKTSNLCRTCFSVYQRLDNDFEVFDDDKENVVDIDNEPTSVTYSLSDVSMDPTT